jgi:hypothetical protein
VESPPALPRIGRAGLYGLGAGLVVALVYGVVSEPPFDLSWGLIVVGLVGGWIIGSAVAAGAWGGRFHLIVAQVRWLAALLAVIAWLVAMIVGYVASQVFYQAAATPLGDRLSVGGFFDYLNSSVISPSILGLAAMAFVAWRVTH